MNDLDEFDRAILEIVQVDNQRTHARIAQEVNLSTSAVRRRLAAMRANDIIIADVSLTNPTVQGLTFIVHVAFEREDPAIYENFKNQMIADPAVSQCYSVSGEYDFVLFAHAATPENYEQWGEKNLMTNTSIRRYSTSLVWTRNKFTTHIKPASA